MPVEAPRRAGNHCLPLALPRMGWPVWLVALLWLLAWSGTAHSLPYRVGTIASGLEYPWSLAFLPDGRLLVTERVGRLRIIDASGRLQPEPVAGVPQAFIARQAGLMDVAVDPDFAINQQIYLSHAYGTPQANNTRLTRAKLVGNRLTEVQTLFSAQPTKAGGAHYGGRIAFLPDGTLLLTLGDGFDHREQAQNLSNHLGKLVRLNRDGTVPRDNPFVGRADAAPEIYSHGHRNMQGVVVDAANKRLYTHEHGPRGGDELNRMAAGGNYGWPIASFGIDYTGARVTPYTTLPGVLPPLLHWTPSVAPSGMALYTGQLFPQWHGNLLVSTLKEKSVRRITLTDGRVSGQEVLFAELGERLRDVRVGPSGAIYLLTDSAQGRVLRVLPSR